MIIKKKKRKVITVRMLTTKSSLSAITSSFLRMQEIEKREREKEKFRGNIVYQISFLVIGS